MIAAHPLLTPQPEHFPPTLVDLPHWSVWEGSLRTRVDGALKWDKQPMSSTARPYNISTKRREQWGPLPDAVSAWDNASLWMQGGLGLCLTFVSGLITIDLDHCRDAVSGEIDAWALEVVQRAGSYVEISPSRTGLRLFLLGDWHGSDWTNHTRGIEVYLGDSVAHARFVTVTGHLLAGSAADVQDAPDGFMQWLSDTYPPPVHQASGLTCEGLPELPEASTLPTLAELNLSSGTRQFLQGDELAGDRSASLARATVELYEATADSAGELQDAVVLALLYQNPVALEVALSHRRGDDARALEYLWTQHCLKVRSKAAPACADDFRTLTARPGEVEPLSFPRNIKTGKVRPSLDYVVQALQRPDYCGVSIAFDQFQTTIMVTYDGQAPRQFTDADYTRIRIQLGQLWGDEPDKAMAKDAVALVAERNQYDSAMDWLRSLEWDGVPRAATFLQRAFGCEDTPYTRAVARYWWTAQAGRVLVPGAQADMVPILVGAQGLGKSTGVALMSPMRAFHADMELGEKDADLSRKIRGKMIIELGELKGLRSKDMESLKAFITRPDELWVPKYQEFECRYMRRCVFVGTTNADEFLTDSTGNRRWLPVQVGVVDRDYIKQWRDQLWAEAAVLFGKGGVDYEEAQNLGTDEHESYMESDPLEREIHRWLEAPEDEQDGVLTTTDVGRSRREAPWIYIGDIIKSLDNVKNIADRALQMRISSILRGMGYSSARRFVDGVTLRVWRKL